MAADAPALTDDEARSLIRPALADRAGPFVLAVSGGPDSVALMRLAAAALPAGGWVVATVDHGLRPESRREVDAVAGWAVSLGLTHRSLTWTEGGRTTARLQERARNARYGLLCGFARELGAAAVLTAHTQDDQAETVLMRLVAGSGIGGLAAMRAATRTADTEIVRPFLPVPKARLLATCQDRRWPYLDDPSNADPRFGRVRARRILAALAPEGLTTARLARLAERAERAEAALEAAAGLAFSRAVLAEQAGRVELDLRRLLSEPEEIGLRVLRLAIERVAAPGGPFRLRRLERLATDLRAGFAVPGAGFSATLAGAHLRLRDPEHLVVTPEPPRRTGGS